MERMGHAGDVGEAISPTELTARSNSTLMFRSIFGQEEETGGEFLEQREALLEHVNWIFANATASNLADYIPWLRFLPNGGAKEARRQAEIGTASSPRWCRARASVPVWTCRPRPAWWRRCWPERRPGK